MSFYVSTANFFLLHCDEWDRVVALPRNKFVTGATLLQLIMPSPAAQALSMFLSILLSLGQSINHDNALYISNYYIINTFLI